MNEENRRHRKVFEMSLSELRAVSSLLLPQNNAESMTVEELQESIMHCSEVEPNSLITLELMRKAFSETFCSYTNQWSSKKKIIAQNGSEENESGIGIMMNKERCKCCKPIGNKEQELISAMVRNASSNDVTKKALEQKIAKKRSKSDNNLIVENTNRTPKPAAQHVITSQPTHQSQSTFNSSLVISSSSGGNLKDNAKKGSKLRTEKTLDQRK